MTATVRQLRRINGAAGAPSAGGEPGQLCLNFPNAAGSANQPELWAYDGAVWRRVNPLAGTQLSIHAAVADATALAGLGFGAGDAGTFVYQQDNGALHYWDGTAFSVVGTIQGAAGPAGPAGATGPAGPSGAIGPAGPAGKDAFPVERHTGTLSGGTVSVVLDGRAQTFTVSANITSWNASLPAGANTSNFEYGKRVDLVANGTRSVSFPSNWKQMGPIDSLSLTSGDYAIVILSTFSDGTIAYTAQVNQ